MKQTITTQSKTTWNLLLPAKCPYVQVNPSSVTFQQLEEIVDLHFKTKLS